MKIQLASDLHLEFLTKGWPTERLVKPAPEADLLVLAGDIGNGIDALQLFESWPVPVVYVAGNHEYYRHDICLMQERLREQARARGIHFLENDCLRIGSVRILGATLWTDYKLPMLGESQEQLMMHASMHLNDHKLIGDGRNTFSPNAALMLNRQSRDWLANELQKPWLGKTVVVTHHACSPLSVHERYQVDPLSAAFASDFPDLMADADLWLHGHVHDGFDYAVGRCRVVANPAGYIKNRLWASKPEEFQFENGDWNPHLVIEV